MTLLTTDLMLLDIPEYIETERLFLRIPQPGEGQEMSAAINESVEDLCAWMDWACGGQTPEESEYYARRMSASFIRREDMVYRIVNKASGLLLGSVGLHTRNIYVPTFEIGYWLRTGQAGHGYMTEAVTTLTHMAFQDLKANRIEIRCDPLNRRSAAVAERTGYVLEGHFRKNLRNHKGELRDTVIYAKIRD